MMVDRPALHQVFILKDGVATETGRYVSVHRVRLEDLPGPRFDEQHAANVGGDHTDTPFCVACAEIGRQESLRLWESGFRPQVPDR